MMADWFSGRAHDEARPSRGHRRPDVSEISPELLIGEYLRHEDVAWLRDTWQVKAVHSLQDSDDLKQNGLDLRELAEAYRAHGIEFVNTPIQDGSADAVAERLEVALSDLHQLVSLHQRVYLHCNAGMNRAPTLAIAFLRAYRKMSLDEAVAHVKKRRVCGPFMTVLEDHFGARDFKPDK